MSKVHTSKIRRLTFAAGCFAAVFAASPGGGYRPPASLPEALPRTYLTSGADVVLSEQAGDHGDPFWRTEFMKMVRWAVG